MHFTVGTIYLMVHLFVFFPLIFSLIFSLSLSSFLAMQEPLTAMQYDPMPDNFSRLRRASISHFKFYNSRLNSQICRYKIYWNIDWKKSIKAFLLLRLCFFWFVCFVLFFCFLLLFLFSAFLVCLFVCLLIFLRAQAVRMGWINPGYKGKQRRHISWPFPS